MPKFSYKANKKLGQHFLKNESVIEEICTSATKAYNFILEIGPGPATLTRFLQKLNKPLYLVERDERFIEELKSLGDNVEVFHQDALEFEISQIKSSAPGWLVSNLPYNVSVPLLMNFLTWENIHEMTLMFQKEVGDKILNIERSNSLSISVHSLYETKIIKRLKPGAFHPPPEVDSIVIHFTKKESPFIFEYEITRFKKFIQSIYDQKRKQIRKFLKTKFPENVDEIFTKYAITSNSRAENLTLEQTIGLYREWEKIQSK